MTRRRSIHPTDAELEILQLLWDSGPAALGVIHKGLCQQRAVAKTTVATILNIMLEKKLVKRTDGARGYLWSATNSRTDVAAGMMGKLIDRVFDGSAQRMVAHLVEGDRLSDEELDEVWRVLKRRREAKRGKKT